jgi:hypothetical protein
MFERRRVCEEVGEKTGSFLGSMLLSLRVDFDFWDA